MARARVRTTDPVYSTPLGIYKPHQGMHNLKYAWGHDEYIYQARRGARRVYVCVRTLNSRRGPPQLVKHNNCTLPPQALAALRFHSCYPWCVASAAAAGAVLLV